VGFLSFVSSSPSFLIQSAASDLNVTDEEGIVSIYNLGDIAWTLTCTALVWIMIPGLGFFYSGLLRRKNALSMIYLSLMTLAVVSFQVCSSTMRIAELS
jgi:Amt family ammonium transporter